MSTIKSAFFYRELDLIVNQDLRAAVMTFLDNFVGDWFWESGASSTGRFHPKFSQGEGGLVRHTKAVVMFAEELLKMSSYAYMKDEYKDYVIAACIIHDTYKYGGKDYDKSCYAEHGKLAAQAFEQWCDVYNFPCSEFLLSAVRGHMGQWTEDKKDRPFTNIDRCVHLADYMASRAFIDIPAITEEYNAIVAQHTTEDSDLPF